MKARAKKILLTLVFLAVGLYVLMTAQAIIGFLLVDSRGTERDGHEMIAHFEKNRDGFESLNTNLLRHRGEDTLVLGDTWTEPEEIEKFGITTSELAKLRSQMDSLGLVNSAIFANEGISYTTYAAGLAVSGNSQGYLYSEDEPSNDYKYGEGLPKEPFRSPVNVRRPREGSYTIYARIAKNWYYEESLEY